MALGSTQPLTEMSIRNTSWGGGGGGGKGAGGGGRVKGGQCVGLTTLLLSCASCVEI
jgi:hypothetical protein